MQHNTNQTNRIIRLKGREKNDALAHTTINNNNINNNTAAKDKPIANISLIGVRVFVFVLLLAAVNCALSSTTLKLSTTLHQSFGPVFMYLAPYQCIIVVVVRIFFFFLFFFLLPSVKYISCRSRPSDFYVLPHSS